MPCPRAPTKSAVKRVAGVFFGWYLRIRKDEEEIGRAGVSWPGLVFWDMHMDGYYPFWKFRSLSNFALTFIDPAIPIYASQNLNLPHVWLRYYSLRPNYKSFQLY